MKAMVCNGAGIPLQLIEIPVPEPGKGEVLVRIKAAALNHRDWFIQKGQYANLKYPVIMGSDGAGIVEIVGEGVTGIPAGQEVIINPGINWGGNPEAPGKEFKILGLPDDGCFAEFVRVPASSIHPKPSHLTFEESAALPLAGLTAFRALVTRGKLKAGEKLLLTGIGGGVALIILKFAKALGAEPFVTSGSELKIQKAVGLGANSGVNYKNEDWHKQLKAMAGEFDVIIDSAGGPGFGKLIELAKPGGRIVIFGGTIGKFGELTPQRIFWKHLNILGTTMGSSEDFSNMLKLVNDYKIVPVIDEIFPLDQAENALRKMDDASQFGKIVLKI